MEQPNQGDKAPASNQGGPAHPVAEENPIQSDSIHIREVWAWNFGVEIKLIRDMIHTKKYNHVAMNTKYPGTIVEPEDEHDPDFVYKAIRDNVNSLKLIQFGLTLFNSKGELPTCGTDKYSIWQFNFCEFDFDIDAMSHSVKKELLESGINFPKFNNEGVRLMVFREVFMRSGAVRNENVQYVTFQGGYDIGYLVKVLSDRDLPEARMGFLQLVKLFFPNIYDLKHISTFINGLHGCLENIAESLGVERIGTSHQAGSYSLLIARTFLKVLRGRFSGNSAPMRRFQDDLAGLVKGKWFPKV